MEISEVRTKRVALEREIARLLAQFTQDTGAQVTSVSVDITETSSIGDRGRGERTFAVAGVHVEVVV